MDRHAYAPIAGERDVPSRWRTNKVRCAVVFAVLVVTVVLMERAGLLQMPPSIAKALSLPREKAAPSTRPPPRRIAVGPIPRFHPPL